MQQNNQIFEKKQTKSYGTEGDYKFIYDTIKFSSSLRLDSVLVTCSEYINSIQFVLKDGEISHVSSKLGEEVGDMQLWQVPEGDKVKFIYINANDFVNAIQFSTERGVSSPIFGSPVGDMEQIEIDGNLYGYEGSTSSIVSEIRFLYFKSVEIPTSKILIPSLSDEHKAIWESYLQEIKNNTQRVNEMVNRKMEYNDKVMKFEFNVVGEKPETGYPLYIALHGGGGCPCSINEGQWNHMKYYYLDSVKCGVYTAIRGVTDTWNLHFVEESYILYDRLIENMIAFQDVDPNRVYITGFSAGGDGTYQIASRMTDRFASANASAGHPNWVSFRNLYNLPVQFQVGEVDTAYERHSVCAKSMQLLKAYQEKDPDGYKYVCNIHCKKPHNFYDNDSEYNPQKVIADPLKWLEDPSNCGTCLRDTNAISYMSQHVRNPIPKRIIWDLTTRACREGTSGFWPHCFHGHQWYWLDIAHHTNESLKVNEIIAHLEPDNNKVVLETETPFVKILLKQSMLNFEKPVEVQLWNGISMSIMLFPNEKTRKKTLDDRGDPYYIFDAIILIEKADTQEDVRIEQVDE